ncbi:hypothetical protein Micbo1qcDRAFT_168142 [Microdochium bolleyi]|uniref:Uncharacterized protein n=1 Tax=Microdochium bolleyi TaxID=196109 RepID=A0A136IP23_9PEZI|nr:hypothetical protein Micbo1qcDRAFT_168142 [Microdochium bolleyi]
MAMAFVACFKQRRGPAPASTSRPVETRLGSTSLSRRTAAHFRLLLPASVLDTRPPQSSTRLFDSTYLAAVPRGWPSASHDKSLCLLCFSVSSVTARSQ